MSTGELLEEDAKNGAPPAESRQESATVEPIEGKESEAKESEESEESKEGLEREEPEELVDDGWAEFRKLSPQEQKWALIQLQLDREQRYIENTYISE